MLGSILAWLGNFSKELIYVLGYPGLVILMAMESMIFPLPSELIMPLAGFLVAEGKFNFWLVALFSSLGSLLGSLISYYLGKFGGNPLILRYGKYLFLDATDLQKTEAWFQKSGEKTIFISRFIPVVRHLISIPAGIAKMDLKKFSVYTVLGATAWNMFLAYLGFFLGERWNEVKHYSEYFSIPAALLLLIVGGYFIYRHIQNKRKERQSEKELLKTKSI
ncbi:MAG TPA: DedA family protein [Candidatus Nanoarchaeia archaeon]|nr:DedA family protein [Candidatus Nanoarchaeia archaeon]